MYTASYIQNQVDAMKSRNTSKADIIRATAEMRLGWQYVYASQGQGCTPQWRRSRIPYCPSEKYVTMINSNCPVLSGKQPLCDGCGYVDTDVFDCAGFVLNVLQLAGVPFYGQGATTQWNTASNWVAKGTIDTMPRGLVSAIYKRKDDKMAHTGLSMGDGNGSAIHCSTTVKRGNVYTDTPKWTHWGIPRGLYTTDELRKAGFDVADDANIPTLRRGNKGEAVEDLQALLNAKYGFNLEIDGNFGSKTEAAVKEFQKQHALTADGIVGPKTWKALGVSVLPDDKNQNPSADNGNNEIVDRDRYVWNTLYNAIKNPYGVAGLMGNLQAESGINPENLQNTGERVLGLTDAQYTRAVDDGTYTAEQFASDGYGYGIAQWTYKSRKEALLKYAKEHGKSIGNLDMQLAFLLDELRFSYSRVWYYLQNAATVREASDSVLLDFERPKNQTEENQVKRAEIGDGFFERFVDANNTSDAQEQPEQPDGVWLTMDEWRTIKAALGAAMTVLKNHEGE